MGDGVIRHNSAFIWYFEKLLNTREYPDSLMFKRGVGWRGAFCAG